PERDHRAELAVQPLDAVEGEGDQLPGSDAAGSHGAGELGKHARYHSGPSVRTLGGGMNASSRTASFTESVIREMTRLALEHDAINLAQGFPDFAPAPEIIQAAHRALDEGWNQYAITWGVPALRAAISAKMARRYGLAYDPGRHITVTCGVTEAIIASVLAIANPGDEVVIIEPFHENFLAAVEFAGARPVYVPLEPPGYELDLDRLRR